MKEGELVLFEYGTSNFNSVSDPKSDIVLTRLGSIQGDIRMTGRRAARLLAIRSIVQIGRKEGIFIPDDIPNLSTEVETETRCILREQ